MVSPLIRMVCGECGSTSVLKDAFAHWDFAKQIWVLEAVYDTYSVCKICQQQVEIISETVQ